MASARLICVHGPASRTILVHSSVPFCSVWIEWMSNLTDWTTCSSLKANLIGARPFTSKFLVFSKQVNSDHNANQATYEIGISNSALMIGNDIRNLHQPTLKTV
jgi:hypothetical protein